MPSRILSLLLQLALAGTLSSQTAPYTRWDRHQVVLDNGLIQRTVLIHDTLGAATVSLKLKGVDRNYIAVNRPDFMEKDDQGAWGQAHRYRKAPPPMEFGFCLDDQFFTGRDQWRIQRIEAASDELQGKGVRLWLTSRDPRLQDLTLSITYLLYPGLPIIRKKLTFENSGIHELKIEGVDVERLNTAWSETQTVVLANYARQRRIGPFLGNWDDPVVVVHDIFNSRGLVLGNETPGVTKRTAVNLDGGTVTVGLTYPDQDYGFRKWLRPGERWDTPWTFIGLYQDSHDPFAVVQGAVADFVRRHMGIRLAKIKNKPVFVYNTWVPFQDRIDEKLIIELAEAAAQCGIEEFIIDAGWFTLATNDSSVEKSWFKQCGDWRIDPIKFPRGLKPVFDLIKHLGMKPGLWISLGTVAKTSTTYAEYPQFWVRDAEGEILYLHQAGDPDNASGCFSTGWPDHMREVILKFIHEYGLAYAKLDLAVVTSPYTYDKRISGCYAKGHLHKDREEALLMSFEKLYAMFDQVHDSAPEVFIDCTFETVGKLQAIDYAMCKHAEGNWLSNFYEPTPVGNLRVRHMAWWRSPAIPAASLVIGNPRMDDPDAILYIKSLAGTLPIMLGDPRKLSKATRAEFKRYSDWLRTMQDRYDYMMYRQDLPGFGEPVAGAWDGWARINTDTHAGGIVGVFRHGAVEESRKIAVPGLESGRRYQILSAPEGKLVATRTGDELMNKGFTVQGNKLYDGWLFEIHALPYSQ